MVEFWKRWDLLKKSRDPRRTLNASSNIPLISSSGVKTAKELVAEQEESDTDGEVEDDGDTVVKKTDVDLEDFGADPQNGMNDNAKKMSGKLKLRALEFLSDIQMDAEKEEGSLLARYHEPALIAENVNSANLVAQPMVGGAGVAGQLQQGQSQQQPQQELDESHLPVVPGEGLMAGPLMGSELDSSAGIVLSGEVFPLGIRLRGTSKFEYASRRALNPMIPGKAMRPSVKSRIPHEQGLINRGVHDSSRVYMSWNKGYPNMTFSVIKYDESSESKRRRKLGLSSVMIQMPRRRNEVPKILSDAAWLKKRWGTSYARYFNIDWAEASGDKVDPVRAAKDESWDRKYNPEALDDPRIRQGKHRTVQTLNGVYLSILPYTKNKDLKAELNEVFREQHPSLPAELTLSKIRNLKREVLEHAKHLNLELSTAALAITYFEKLVFKGVVDKANRKLVMSVCLVLAYKFNEPKRPGMATLKELLEDIERVQSLSPKQVLEAEFPAFGHLLFHLNAPKEHMLTHFSRLLKMMDSTPTEYLGEDLASFYFPDEEHQEIEEIVEQPLASPTPRKLTSHHHHHHHHRDRDRDRDHHHHHHHRDRDRDRDYHHHHHHRHSKSRKKKQ